MTRIEENGSDTVTVADIREGAPPPALFAVPPDYGNFDPQQLIERIRHSDVWVEPQ